MSKEPPSLPGVHQEESPWRKNKKLLHSGFKDLEYLPRAPTGWNATLAGLAFSARRKRQGTADLNLWAAMHGCPASGRYEALGDHALVLWHGTSAARATKIREAGLFHRRGLWTAKDPRIAHGYTRWRSEAYGAGSAMIVLVLDQREMLPGIHYTPEGMDICRFHARLAPEHIEYILWGDRIEFLGPDRAAQPASWGIYRFKRKGGRWVPLSQPPVRLDDEHTYTTREEWLRLSIRRIFAALGTVSAIEAFSSLYSTIDPRDALRHEEVFEALDEQAERHRAGGRRNWYTPVEADTSVSA